MSLQHQQEKWSCGHQGHSSIDHTNAGITRDILISPEQCRALAKGKEITPLDRSISFGFDTKNSIVKTIGDTSNNSRNKCDGSSWITYDTLPLRCKQQQKKLHWKVGKFCSILD